MKKPKTFRDQTLRAANTGLSTRVSAAEKAFVVDVAKRLDMPIRELLTTSVTAYAKMRENDE